jgi:APA family basic amino acid/polyamine antiporter
MTAPTLQRAITGRLLFLFILGDVLGAGIYALVGAIAAETGGAVWVPLLVALGLALLTAGSYAELVTKHPQAGGAAVFARRAYRSPAVAFLVGFCMAAAGVVSAAGLALAFSGDYLAELVDVPQVPAAVAFLLLVALLNARGIKESLRANVVMTVVEVTGLLLVVVLGVLVLGHGDGDAGRVVELKDGVSGPGAVLGGALLAYYSFVGFETSANVAEETVDVRRTYPRALFGALLLAGAAYVLVGLAVSAAVPTDQLAASSAPLLEVVRISDTGLPPDLFSLIALVAVANGALLTLVMASRLVFGMARDGLLPPVLARVLPRRRTPGVAIVATTLLAIALVATGDLAALAETVVLLLLVVFTSTNLAVLVLRREVVEHDHVRVPTVVPVLGIASCVLLATQQSAGTWARTALLLALGVVLYAVSRAPGLRGAAVEPYPDESAADAPARR